jgi:hypothetical protein
MLGRELTVPSKVPMSSTSFRSLFFHNKNHNGRAIDVGKIPARLTSRENLCQQFVWLTFYIQG